MMKLKRITVDEYEGFVLTNPYIHYMKTKAWATLKEKQGYTTHYLGFYKNNTLVATALVLQYHYLHSKYLYIPNGMCLDYDDTDLLKNVLKMIINYAKGLNVTFLRIDPNVLRQENDILVNPIENGINHENVTSCFKEMGFIHKGYNFAYDGSWYNRYSLAVDLSDDINIIKKRFNKKRITALNRHAIINLHTRLGTKEDLKYLCAFEKQLAAKEGFKPHSMKFFQDILDAFGEHARLYIVQLNIDDMVNGLQKELSSKKYAKDKEARESKEKELSYALSLQNNLKDKEIVLACGLFIYYNHKSWDLYTYNDKHYSNLNAVDNLHYYAMQDLKQLGVSFYDMCGFSGISDKHDPHYGLYDYKRSFGSYVVENIGEFDYIFKPLNYKLFKKEKVLSYHFHSRLNRIKYIK